MLFLVWYDPDAQRPVGEKLQHASAACTWRFNVAPNLALVNGADMTILDEIEVRGERTVQPHHFRVGRSDAHDQEVGARSDA